MKTEYEINSSTIAIIGIEKNLSKVIEGQSEFYVGLPAIKIIDESCKYFGSSYEGRFDGTKNLTGVSYKSPIIVEETRNIIFFPTESPRNITCSWISLNKLEDYKRLNNKTLLIFINKTKLELNMSYESLENQILRATRLDAILRKRKNLDLTE